MIFIANCPELVKECLQFLFSFCMLRVLLVIWQCTVASYLFGLCRPGVVYVSGGWFGILRNHSSCEKHRVGSGQWEKMANLNRGRHDHAMLFLGGKIAYFTRWL